MVRKLKDWQSSFDEWSEDIVEGNGTSWFQWIGIAALMSVVVAAVIVFAIFISNKRKISEKRNRIREHVQDFKLHRSCGCKGT